MLAYVSAFMVVRSKIALISRLLLISFALVACSSAPPSTSTPSREPTATDVATGTETAIPYSPTPNPTAQPRAFLLKVPLELTQAAAEAIDAVETDTDQPIWQLDVGQPSLDDLETGWVDAILIEGTQGTIVAQRPIALAVPFTSLWTEITLTEAEAVIEQGSDFIQPLDWAEMQPGLKSLLVNGMHPSNPEYPLQRSWSVVASDQARPALPSILPALKASIEHDPQVRLSAVGDLMLARTVGAVLETGDLDYPFAHVTEHLLAADLAIGNLESALGEGGIPENKGYTFRAPMEAASALALAGFDLLSLANNHAMDFGPTLLIEAIAALEAQGIQTVGAGEDEVGAHQIHLAEHDGLRIAFLAYVDVPTEFRGFDTRSWQAGEAKPGVAWADIRRMQIEIQKAGQQADLVVVLLHSGYEYVPQPSPPQIAAARVAVEAGADLVLGHHAHILQPVEFHPQGTIVYGLGNFVFEDAGPPKSALLNAWLDEDGLRELQFVPVRLDSEGRPVPVSGEAAEAILADIFSYTAAWEAQTPTLEP